MDATEPPGVRQVVWAERHDTLFAVDTEGRVWRLVNATGQVTPHVKAELAWVRLPALPNE